MLKYNNIEFHNKWKDALNANSIEEFTSILSQIVKDCTMLKQCNGRRNNEWITNEIIQLKIKYLN